MGGVLILSFFFFNDTATTEIYTLSLHDALPICSKDRSAGKRERRAGRGNGREKQREEDRKSTRLNSSHLVISYAVFCLKKKKPNYIIPPPAHDPQSITHIIDAADLRSTSTARCH